jgi:ABC-type transport system involved in multi-copper enzyme maturation permease subunit
MASIQIFFIFLAFFAFIAGCILMGISNHVTITHIYVPHEATFDGVESVQGYVVNPVAGVNSRDRCLVDFKSLLVNSTTTCTVTLKGFMTCNDAIDAANALSKSPYTVYYSDGVDTCYMTFYGSSTDDHIDHNVDQLKSVSFLVGLGLFLGSIVVCTTCCLFLSDSTDDSHNIDTANTNNTDNTDNTNNNKFSTTSWFSSFKKTPDPLLSSINNNV